MNIINKLFKKNKQTKALIFTFLTLLLIGILVRYLIKKINKNKEGFSDDDKDKAAKDAADKAAKDAADKAAKDAADKAAKDKEDSDNTKFWIGMSVFVTVIILLIFFIWIIVRGSGRNNYPSYGYQPYGYQPYGNYPMY